jgi:hypothetical protein
MRSGGRHEEALIVPLSGRRMYWGRVDGKEGKENE